MFKMTTLARLSIGLLALGLGAAACGDDTAAAGGLEASGAWARTSPMNAEAGAAYMTLTADEATSIVSASVSADIADRVELHETVPVEEDGEMDAMGEDGEMADDSEDGAMADDSEMEGMEEGHEGHEGMEDMAMTMREVSAIEITAGGEAVLAPGGLHLMIMELAEPLEIGQTFDITLVTEAGDELVVPVEVRDEAP